MKVSFSGSVKDLYGNTIKQNYKRETVAPTLAKAKSYINWNAKKDCHLNPKETKVILTGKFTIIEE